MNRHYFLVRKQDLNYLVNRNFKKTTNMNFDKLVNERYSVRKFSDQKVESEKLIQVLESARKAPSAVNFQPYKIFVVESAEKLSEIKSCYHRNWFETAPLVLVVVGLHDMAWKRGIDGKDHMDIDTAIVTDHIMLQAAELELGTCWICNFDVEKTKDVLGLSATEEPVALVPLGYPENKEVPVKKRKGLDEIVVRI